MYQVHNLPSLMLVLPYPDIVLAITVIMSYS